jgi:hypothetical protein
VGRCDVRVPIGSPGASGSVKQSRTGSGPFGNRATSVQVYLASMELYQPAETLTHARMLRVRAKLPYPIGPPDVFAMAVSVVARAA